MPIPQDVVCERDFDSLEQWRTSQSERRRCLSTSLIRRVSVGITAAACMWLVYRIAFVGVGRADVMAAIALISFLVAVQAWTRLTQRAERAQHQQNLLIEASDVFAAARTEAEVERAVVNSCVRMITDAKNVTVAYARIDGDAVVVTEAAGHQASTIAGVTCTLEELVTNVAVEVSIPSLCPEIPTIFGAYLRSEYAVCGVLWIGGSGSIPDDVFPIIDTLTKQAVSSTERLRSEQRLTSMIESSADVLAVIRPDGVIDWMSPAFSTLTGHDVSAAIDMPLRSFIHDDDIPALMFGLRAEGVETQVLTLRWSNVDEGWRQTESKLCAVAVTGKGTWWTLSSRDVSERVALEMELRHAQKLEAVGRLAAGVAHEINTPVQFISNNLQFLAGSLNEFVDLLSHYRSVVDVYRSTASAEQRTNEQTDELANITAHEERTDVEFLKEQVPLAISEALDGTGRVATIVQAMKTFGHPDGADRTLLDINVAINSTLTIARNELKYVADVKTDLAELPGVLCYAGDVNQVLLNLFVNAAHAITDRYGDSGERGHITVRTRTEGTFIVIEVSDTGTGIPPDVQRRVFDPFFTTKEVGRGTGQGLSLAKNVVNRHGGTITFDTVPGEGTTFFVRLPMDDKSSSQAFSAPSDNDKSNSSIGST